MAFDAFISFKNTAQGGGHTVDYEIAKKLHKMLLDEGMNVFFSEKDLSTAEFAREIYHALDEARLLILIGSSVEYINSKWVESEWQNFLGAIYSGKKPGGQVITVLSGISARELPIQLSNLQSFSAGDLDSAVSFAFKALGMVRNSEVRERLAAEAARKEREAEEARLAEMRRQMEAELRAERERKRAAKGGKRWVTVAAVVVCLLVVLGVAVGFVGYYRQQEELSSHFIFNEVDGGYEIASYRGGLDGDLVLPSMYRGMPVVGIGESAFDGYDSLTSISIPSSVRTIGDSAFRRCTGLTSVTIADSVTSIGNNAFVDCTGLASVTIPDSVTSIGKGAFFAATSP